jgi:ribosome-binding factor A
LKFLPEIHFEEDDAIERAEHIEAVLRRLREDDGER